MNRSIRLALGIAAITLCLPFARKGTARTDLPRPQRAVERGLSFLERDALLWKKEHACASCHQGAITVWALSEAVSRGYATDPARQQEIVRWTKDSVQASALIAPGARPGANIPSLALVYLALSGRTNPKLLTTEETEKIARHLTERQEADGAWPAPPPTAAIPPVSDSRETITLWTTLALEPTAAREKSSDWLARNPPADTTQAAALRLLIDSRAGRSAKLLRPGIQQLLARQNADGGWSQIKELPSDAYATGLALYALNAAGVPQTRPAIRRGVSFLVADQREDGSWPMTPRGSAERKPSKNPSPIICFGSAWATLGLLRSLPGPTP